LFGRVFYCGDAADFSAEKVAVARFAVHSDLMTSSGSGGRYYWCLRHHRVEDDSNSCPSKYQLGPYGSADEAERGLERIRERNDEWEAEDARWSGEER
jgi:hypothetical protein